MVQYGGNYNFRKQLPLLPQHPHSCFQNAWLGETVALSLASPTRMIELSMKEANFLSSEEVLASTSWAPKSRRALSMSFVRLFCLLPQVQNIVLNNQEFGLSENEPSHSILLFRL